MKTKILLLFIILPLLSQATVWRVNGNSGIDADFADVPETVTAASAGDTIYVEPWVDGIYSTTTVGKPLTILGGGYYISQNDSTQYIDQWTNINRVIFVPGSAGSKIAGVQFVNRDLYDAGQDAGRRVFGSIIIDECCITVERCFSNEDFTLGLTSRADNCIIQNCFFENSGNKGRTTFGKINLSIHPELQGTGVQNTVINNSVIGAIEGEAISSIQESIISLSVNNCIIYWQSNDGTRNTIFSNCIFTRDQEAQIAQANVSFFNNLDVFDNIPAGNGNQLNIPFATIFDSEFSDHPELQFKLAEGSPAIGAAIDGGDCGIFGGDFPYVLSGMPNIPSIFELTVDPTAGGDEQTLDVNLKAKSHD